MAVWARAWPTAGHRPKIVAMFLVVGSIIGLLIIVGVMSVAIRILRQPTYRYQGDPTPQRRRSFRETMVYWFMGVTRL